MATIVMESARVIDACASTIARIKAERAKRDNQTIDNAIEFKRKFSFKRGFYRMTREEARKWINKQGSFSHWDFSYYAWGDLDHAKKLLKLAQLGDPVTLNETDIQVIFN